MLNKVMRKPERVNLSDLWETVVRSYSRGQLTVNSDRLSALSGVALQFQNLGMGNLLKFPSGRTAKGSLLTLIFNIVSNKRW